MAQDSPLDRFKAVLAGAARAVADEPDVELAFTADAPAQSGKHLKVPMPARGLPPGQVAEARGFADGFALRLRHHDAGLHGRGAPADPVARAVFDAVEWARVEALGSRGYAGIADNLGVALDTRLRSDPIARARTSGEVPLSTALQLLVREALTGEAAPAAAAPGLGLVRGGVEGRAARSGLGPALAAPQPQHRQHQLQCRERRGQPQRRQTRLRHHRSSVFVSCIAPSFDRASCGGMYFSSCLARRLVALNEPSA